MPATAVNSASVRAFQRQPVCFFSGANGGKSSCGVAALRQALCRHAGGITANPLCAGVALRGESLERFRSALEVKMRVGGTPFVQSSGAIWARCGRQICVYGHLAFAYTAQNCLLCPLVPRPCLGLVICLLLVTEMAWIVPKTALELYGYHIYVSVIVNAAGLVVYGFPEDPHSHAPASLTSLGARGCRGRPCGRLPRQRMPVRPSGCRLGRR